MESDSAFSYGSFHILDVPVSLSLSLSLSFSFSRCVYVYIYIYIYIYIYSIFFTDCFLWFSFLTHFCFLGSPGTPCTLDGTTERVWSKAEMSVLSKAVKKYPAGTGQRWNAICSHMNDLLKPSDLYGVEVLYCTLLLCNF